MRENSAEDVQTKIAHGMSTIKKKITFETSIIYSFILYKAQTP